MFQESEEKEKEERMRSSRDDDTRISESSEQNLYYRLRGDLEERGEEDDAKRRSKWTKT